VRSQPDNGLPDTALGILMLGTGEGGDGGSALTV